MTGLAAGTAGFPVDLANFSSEVSAAASVNFAVDLANLGSEASAPASVNFAVESANFNSDASAAAAAVGTSGTESPSEKLSEELLEPSSKATLPAFDTARRPLKFFSTNS